jgi:hypothetical protein
MALLFVDGFDTYQGNDWAKRWTTAYQSQTPTFGAGYARSGAAGWRPTSTQWMGKVLSASGSTGILGLACYFEGSGGLDVYIGNVDDLYQLRFLRSAAGPIVIRRGVNQTIATGTIPLAATAWYYLEIKWTLHATAGATEVRINGVTDSGCTLSGIDTLNTGTSATWNRVEIGCTFNTDPWYCDDLYICDTAGSVNNDFLGDVTVQGLLPNGNGTYSQFVGSDGDSTNNYLLVDEVTVDYPDDDGTYVQSGTIGYYDTYNYPALSTTATVLGVQVAVCAKKTDTGTRLYTTAAKLSGASVTDGSTTIAPSDSSYSYGLEVWNEKPGGGSWTVSDVDSAEFGVKVTG